MVSLGLDPIVLEGVLAEAVEADAAQVAGGDDAIGILNLPYINNTLGVDLLREERQFIYFGADDKYGVLNDKFFLIADENKGDSLYKYEILADGRKDVNNYLQDNLLLVNEMKKYAESMMQITQWMINNRLVGTGR